MTPFSPFSFFLVVLQPARRFAITSAIVLGTAGWLAWNDPADIEEATALALLCQMFAAATGFREQARRGHFDPVLVAGTPRHVVATAHWACSALPGVLTWMLLAGLERWTNQTMPPVPLTAAGTVAFLWVSVMAWTLALPLSRYSSGIIWLLTLLVVVAAEWAEKLHEPFRVAGHGWADVLRLAGAGMVNPFLLLMNPDAPRFPSYLVTVFVVCVAAVTGVSFICHHDNVLQDPS